MSRRASLPGAAELFRSTTPAQSMQPAPTTAVPSPQSVSAAHSVSSTQSVSSETPGTDHAATEALEFAAAVVSSSPTREAAVRELRPAATARVEDLPGSRTTSGVRRTTRAVRSTGSRQPSGRERHDEKITVYCSPDELVDIESARLHLRAEHGLAVDRGRIVREAIAVVLADFEAKGESSILVRRLRELTR